MSTKIAINLVDMAAKRYSATPSSPDKMFWFGPTQVKFNAGIARKFATLEQDFTLLDDSFVPFPDAPSNDDGNQYGWWTASMSDASGNFATNPALTVQFTQQITSPGITITFFDDYPLEIVVDWYSGAFGSANTLILSKTFQPDALQYFCDQAVVGYTKIVITITKTKPYRRVKLSNIEYGRVMQWAGEDVVSAKVLEEVNPVSNELSINTADFELYDASGAFDILNLKGLFTYLQKGQQVVISNDDDGSDNPMGTFYLDTWESSDTDVGKFTAYDAIGRIDNARFEGGIYAGKPASDLVAEIMTAAGWDNYDLAAELQSIQLTGYIPISSCREALQQVAFALCATVSDARSDRIRIFRALRSYSQILGRDRKFDGGKTTLLSKVSAVTVLAHNYTIKSGTEEIYRGTVSPGISRIYLQEPAANVISDTDGIGTTWPIDDSPESANVVWVRSTLTEDAELVLTGQKYADNTTPYSASNADYGGSPVNVEKATLISAGNAQDVAKNLLTYYNLRFQTEADFPLEEEQAGDKIAVENKSGVGYSLNTAESLSIDLVGGMVATAKLLSDGTDLVMAVYCGDLYCGESLGVM